MTQVQVTKKQKMSAIIRKLEALEVENGYKSADVLGEELPIAGIPGSQVAALFQAP